MRKEFPDFLVSFERIQNYLAKAPHVTHQELIEAIDAYNAIIATIYGHEEGVGAPCISGHIKFIATAK